MRHKDRLLILTVEGTPIKDAQDLARQEDGVLVVGVLGFVDGVIGSTAEAVVDTGMRECVGRIAAVIEPMLDTESRQLFGHAVLMKLRTFDGTFDEL